MIGSKVKVRWVEGWRLPPEVDGREGVITVDERPRRVAVKLYPHERQGLWFPPEAVSLSRTRVGDMQLRSAMDAPAAATEKGS